MLCMPFLAAFLAASVAVSGVVGGRLNEVVGLTRECESLGRDMCAFAVSSSGMRCVLEKEDGQAEEYTCRTSSVKTAGVVGWVETDDCVAACRLDRNTLGISSDSLLDRRFVRGLCSSECYLNCPNIVDLYFSVAAGEGVFLPDLCRGNGRRREMTEEFGPTAEPDDTDSTNRLLMGISGADSESLAPAPAS